MPVIIAYTTYCKIKNINFPLQHFCCVQTFLGINSDFFRSNIKLFLFIVDKDLTVHEA